MSREDYVLILAMVTFWSVCVWSMKGCEEAEQETTQVCLEFNSSAECGIKPVKP